MSQLSWQKSTFSENQVNCVHVASAADGTIRLRESDDPGVIVTTTPAQLAAFILSAKAGEFDHLR
ncbi:DUF397 domain-containing protein [Streptomyces sp. H10-C2]|uniref:DUF397 domain-containing protein n=1 Tax=unclassified Streptomyces TaxID=2593676 RepID=UPI0024BABE48|nr:MULTISPECIES: DUF397 domain-containing protein [unclassified Streptomyces]MDJ0347075.1 DUF397 domain-containing protein [Streptomyces sp. PH10-H1]MDJ0374421.1 DUF397 domain-containing protein [Streptomyces sp. H10-C2]